MAFGKIFKNTTIVIRNFHFQTKRTSTLIVSQIRCLRNLPWRTDDKENVVQIVTNDSRSKLDQKLDAILQKEKNNLSELVHPKERSTSKLPAKNNTEGQSYVPTFNLAAYVNKSESLQELIKLGVDLSKIERRQRLAEFVLRLNFENDVKPYLIFLNNHGVEASEFGNILTKNPLLLKENLDDLETRINYLNMKKFTPKQIERILTKNPFWLMFSTVRIDKRLGHFQGTFKLAGDDVRFLADKQPRLVTYNMEHIRRNTFCIREEMGFDEDETKCLLLNKPRLWMLKSDELVERFAYAHNEMKLTHDTLIQFPEVLISREFRLRQRHEFLKLLGRAQYDPEKDLYISPKTLVNGTDREFAVNVAKSDMKTFELFMKTK